MSLVWMTVARSKNGVPDKKRKVSSTSQNGGSQNNVHMQKRHSVPNIVVSTTNPTPIYSHHECARCFLPPMTFAKSF